MSKNKKIVFASAAVILIASIGLFAYNLILNPATGGTVHKMILTEDGYTPADITISKGDTIEFSTTLDKPFWPASNIHPTHGIYPEFDPMEPVEPSKTWSFRFDETGTWQYHDHLAPYYTGTITVQ